MSTPSTSQVLEITQLRQQLATAEKRLDRAQSFVFELRCLVASKDGKGIWMREKDRSGLKAAIWEDKSDLGAWVLIKVSSSCSGLLPPPLLVQLSRSAKF
jgi:hypothetical protein